MLTEGTKEARRDLTNDVTVNCSFKGQHKHRRQKETFHILTKQALANIRH